MTSTASPTPATFRGFPCNIEHWNRLPAQNDHRAQHRIGTGEMTQRQGVMSTHGSSRSYLHTHLLLQYAQTRLVFTVCMSNVSQLEQVLTQAHERVKLRQRHSAAPVRVQSLPQVRPARLELHHLSDTTALRSMFTPTSLPQVSSGAVVFLSGLQS